MQSLPQDVTRATKLMNPLFYFLIALIPFSVRHVFSSTWNFKTGAYSDFTSLSLYISDIVLVALLFIASWCFMWNYIAYRRVNQSSTTNAISRPLKIWLGFAVVAVGWLALELLIQSRETLSLQAYFSFRFVLLIGLALTMTRISVSREKLAWLFSILGGIQSLIAMFQFYYQKSIGLYVLGESHLSPETLGVAKIVSHGTKLIRSYGTFPHSNLISAFLVCATLLNLYLLIKKPQTSRGIWVYILLLLNLFGLFLTFSRGGILALGIGLLAVLSVMLINKRFSQVRKLFVPVSLIIAGSILILSPYLSTRTTISDSAVKERLFYNDLGKKIVADKPVFGLGSGISVLHMKHYSGLELEPWEIQPIHNYYLISWAEWGIGAIPLLALVTLPIFVLFKRKIGDWQLILFSIGISFLVLFMFDHYFYTIWPTQLLLWIIVGLCLRETTSKVGTTYDNSSQD